MALDIIITIYMRATIKSRRQTKGKSTSNIYYQCVHGNKPGCQHKPRCYNRLLGNCQQFHAKLYACLMSSQNVIKIKELESFLCRQKIIKALGIDTEVYWPSTTWEYCGHQQAECLVNRFRTISHHLKKTNTFETHFYAFNDIYYSHSHGIWISFPQF